MATGLSGGLSLRGQCRQVPALMARIQAALGRNLDKLELVQLTPSHEANSEMREGIYCWWTPAGWPSCVTRYPAARRPGHCLARRYCRICSNCSNISVGCSDDAAGMGLASSGDCTVNEAAYEDAQEAGIRGHCAGSSCHRARCLYPVDGCRVGLPRLAWLLWFLAIPAPSMRNWRHSAIRPARLFLTRRAARWCIATSPGCWEA